MSHNFQMKQAATAGDTFSDSAVSDVILNIINGPVTRSILAGFSSTASNATMNASKMRISSNIVSVAGVLSATSVGIGTLTPQSALDIVGTVNVSSNIVVTGGGLSVSGVTTLGSNLSVAGGLSVVGGLSVTGALSVAGILNVAGQILQVATGSAASNSSTSMNTSNLVCQTLQVTNTLTLGSNAISFTNGSGNSITAQTWNYMQSYVFPTAAPSVSRTLFMGVAQNHSAYVQNGSVYVFGSNGYGQLGTGDLVNRPLPTLVPGLSGALAVACGQGFTVVLLTNGTAVAMGYNGNGMLGDGTTVNRLVPTPVLGVSTATNVVAGYYHTLFLLANGTVVGYGSSSNGQLGAGTTSVINTSLVAATLPTGSPSAGFVCRAIDAGAYHSVLLLVNGTAYSFGQNTYAQLGQGNTAQLTVPTLINLASLIHVVNVGAGQYHTLLVLYDGTVLSCGRNDAGQCGVGSTASPQTGWTAIVAAPGASNVSAGLATYVAAGTAHTVVQKADGTVWVFGSNALGQLGAGSAVASYTAPTQLLMSYAVYTAFAIAAGANHTVILLNNDVTVPQKNRIVAFGDNSSGPVGTSLQGVVTAYTPFPIFDGAMIYGKRLVGGSVGYVVGYLDMDGTAYLCGADDSGQLGDSSTVNKAILQPISRFNFVVGTVRLTSVVAGANHCAAIDSNGSLYTWGNGTNGQLGNNTVTNNSTPQLVSYGSLAGKIIVSVALGGQHSVALDSGGAVHTWGLNSSGQLGNNSNTQSTVPINVSGFGSLAGRTVLSIATGWMSTTCMDSTNFKHSWGIGAPPTNSIQPIQYFSNVSMVAMGYSHIIAIQNGGTAVLAFGNNSNGQLGDGTNTTRSSAVSISTISGSSLIGRTFVAVACGAYHSLALDSTGSVFCWGANNWGQVGSLASAEQWMPVNISGNGSLTGRTVITISGASDHCSALDSTGTIHVWGRGAEGQNGNGLLSGMYTVPTLLTLNTRNLNVPMFSHGGLGDNKLLKGRNADLGVLLSVGANQYGQIGDGTTTTRPNLVALATLSNAVMTCASGVNHSGAVTSNGSCYLWGRNNLGQCSSANSNNILTPTLVTPSITNAASVYCGTGCTFITLVDGSVVALGDNTSNQLGVSSAIASASNAVVVNGLTNVVQLSSGGGSSLALTSARSVYSWGTNALGATGQGTLVGTTSNATLVDPSPWNSQPVARITSGKGVSALVTANGSCYTCGANTEGALGQPTNFGTPGGVSTFGLVSDPNSTYLTGFGNAVVDARCGSRHTVLLLANNTVRVFGTNASGQLTGSIGPNQWQPHVAPPNVLNNAVVAISASAHSTLKEYVDRTTTSTGVGFSAVTQLMISSPVSSSSFFVTPSGVVYGCGQIGGQSQFTSYATSGSLATAWITQVSCNNLNILFVDSLGLVHALGTNAEGELGNGTTTTISTPTCISYVATSSLVGVVVLQVGMGIYHAVALDSSGAVHSWGTNADGQLGNGTTTALTLPSRIMSVSGSSLQGLKITSIAAGYAHALALDSNGQVHCWGLNSGGQIGVNSTVSQPTPVNISLLPANSIYGKVIISIGAGVYHSLAIDSNGFAHSWGTNTFGQLGTGDQSNRLVTVGVSGSGTLSGKYLVTANGSQSHSCWLDTLGSMHVCGNNADGQLGDGTTNNTFVPESPMASALSGRRVVAMATGWYHTVALDSTGLIITWAAQRVGQLGNNSTGVNAGVTSPIQISNNYGITQALTAGVLTTSLAGITTTLMSSGSGGANSFILSPLGVAHGWGLMMSSTTPVSLATYGSLKGVFLKSITGSGTTGGIVMACDSAGTVHASGANTTYGCIGLGSTTASVITPAFTISSVSGSSLNGVRIVLVRAGLAFMLALDSNGNLHVWGSNDNGNLGDVTTTTRPLPIQIMGVSGSSLNGKTIVSMSAGYRHSLAIDSNGLVHAFGDMNCFNGGRL